MVAICSPPCSNSSRRPRGSTAARLDSPHSFKHLLFQNNPALGALPRAGVEIHGHVTHRTHLSGADRVRSVIDGDRVA